MKEFSHTASVLPLPIIYNMEESGCEGGVKFESQNIYFGRQDMLWYIQVLRVGDKFWQPTGLWVIDNIFLLGRFHFTFKNGEKSQREILDYFKNFPQNSPAHHFSKKKSFCYFCPILLCMWLFLKHPYTELTIQLKHKSIWHYVINRKF